MSETARLARRAGRNGLASLAAFGDRDGKDAGLSCRRAAAPAMNTDANRDSPPAMNTHANRRLRDLARRMAEATAEKPCDRLHDRLAAAGLAKRPTVVG